jgi:hypothetical protein
MVKAVRTTLVTTMFQIVRLTRVLNFYNYLRFKVLRQLLYQFMFYAVRSMFYLCYKLLELLMFKAYGLNY